MMGVAGNESIINTEPVLHDGQRYDVPMLSGNALRHKLVREPGAEFITKACGLYGKLTEKQANYLWYGGSLTDSSISDNLKKIADMQELLPLIRLLGGSLENQVVSGSLDAGLGTLICEENRERLIQLLPAELLQGLPPLRSYVDYVSTNGHLYTRSDAASIPEALAIPDDFDEDAKKGKSNRMIYGGQNVISGAVFYTYFQLKNVSHLEVGALVAALKDWSANDGTIGGMGRIGHGQMSIGVYLDDAATDWFGDRLDLDTCEAAYREHTHKYADKIAEWLNNAFPAKKPKEVKPVSKKKPTAVTEQVDFFDRED
jgi:hypothetical protein